VFRLCDCGAQVGALALRISSAVLHALAWHWIGFTERGETIDTRIYLKAIAGIIGWRGIGVFTTVSTTDC